MHSIRSETLFCFPCQNLIFEKHSLFTIFFVSRNGSRLFLKSFGNLMPLFSYSRNFEFFFQTKYIYIFFLMLVFFLSCSICQIIFEFTLDLIQSYFVKFAFYFRQKHYKFPKYTRCAKIWMKHHIGWNPIFEFWMFITIFQQKLLFHTCCLMAIKEKWKCNCMA